MANNDEGRVETDEFSVYKNSGMTASSCRNGIKLGCDCRVSARPCLVVSCAVKLTKCVDSRTKATTTAGVKDMTANRCGGTYQRCAQSMVIGGGDMPSVEPHGERTQKLTGIIESTRFVNMKSVDAHVTTGCDSFQQFAENIVAIKCRPANKNVGEADDFDENVVHPNSKNNMNNQRSLRFDSSESSDSGVTTLSNADYSPSSGNCDITDLDSPGSSVPSPGCVCPPADGVHLTEYSTGSPPSSHGSDDSGLEETIVPSSNSLQTLDNSQETDHSSEKEEYSPCSITDDGNLLIDALLFSSIPSSGLFDSSGNSDSCSVNQCDGNGNTCHDWLDSQDSKTSCEDDAPCYFATPFNYKKSLATLQHSHKEWNSSAHVFGSSDASVRESVMTSQIGSCMPHVFRHLSKFAQARNCIRGNSTSDPFLRCQWLNCGKVLPYGGDIVDHIRSLHVDAQVNADSFVCQWEGCKVYNRSSCSLSWLERHVLSHSGNKPFKCIVEGCGQRFTSQTILERHVNSHFNQPHTTSQSNMSKRKEDTPNKILKKRKLRFRRTAWMARKEDFFDSGVMECVRHQLFRNRDKARLDLEFYGSHITFHSTVIGMQVEDTGKLRVLLHWIPENLIPDEWVHESQVLLRSKQTVPVSNLPLDSLKKLDPMSGCSLPLRYNRKNQRK